MDDEQSVGERWSDAPRDRTDISGRSDFAKVVADRIELSPDGQPSTVFGLVGPWGSGKTTLLKTIASHLPEWKVVWFSPWSVSDVGSITAEFVTALAGAFPQKRKVRKAIAKYARFGVPVLNLIPFAGPVAATLADQTLVALSKRPAWHEAFDSLSLEIASQHVRVLMIVDDVDRLDSEELRALLRVVRLLGRFQNVHYLMAYDEATIDGVLGAQAQGESSQFMEKIVQYPFEVPPASMLERRRWGREIVDSLSSARVTDDHREQLVGALAAGLDTPRAANRLREQLVSLAVLVAAAEVDVLDFIALTWLRTTHHGLWDHIRLNRDQYLDWTGRETSDAFDQRRASMRSLIRRSHSKPAENIVAFLFEPPTVESALAGDRRWRLRNSRYFDRYFHIGIDDADVSEQVVEQAVSTLLAGESGPTVQTLRSVVFGPDTERSVLALEIANGFRTTGSDSSREMLDFAVEARSHFESDPTGPGMSAADRLMTREITTALETHLIPAGELAERFGYLELVAGAWSLFRSRKYQETEWRHIYAPLAALWTEEVRTESAAVTSARPELIGMTSLLMRLGEERDYRGFLGRQVSDAESLLQLASAFVTFKTWHGSGVEYELDFRINELDFALGADPQTYRQMLGDYRVDDVPPYEVVDRPDMDLSEPQRKHYAFTRLVDVSGD